MLKINRKIILGSGSPRRKQLLEMIGLEPIVIKSDVEEVVQYGLSPEQVVLNIAMQKAIDIMPKIDDESLLITADTIVVCESRIIGKPRDEEDAFKILKFLSGKRQIVYTGVIVWDKKTGVRYEIVEESAVYFKELEDEDIERYINTGDAKDKAGAYGVQTEGAVLVERIEGDFYNIVGMPVSKLYDVLKEIE